MNSVDHKASLVTFRTSQEAELRANLLRFSRYLVVLELHTPDEVLRTSEVLNGFKIICQDRTLYSGRALVRNLVTTGLVTVCEATLDEGWMNLGVSGGPLDGLGAQFQSFLSEWERLYRVAPDYKMVIADLQTFLTDVRLWLEEVELHVRSSPTGDRMKLENDIVHQLEQSVVPPIANLFDRFENVSQRVGDDLQPAHRAFGKRWLHPLLLCSPFVYRTYRKPLGYAGDYEMVNMMFRDPFEGASMFAKVINAYALQLPPIIAHRNRVAFLRERISEETRRVARLGRAARIFNLGCGPAREVQEFLQRDRLEESAHFVLADFNEETIAHTRRALGDLLRRNSRQTQIQLVQKSVQQILKQAERTLQHPDSERYDLVYCAGLFDYLSDKVCRKLVQIFYGMLAPGGLLLVTNVDTHPSRGEMECFLEWHLVHRDTRQVESLQPEGVSPDQIATQRDATGVNIFMSIRKPDGER